MKVDSTIVAAAERLLASAVGAEFTIDQLAAATGLSRATLYRRIGSKEALLTHLAARQGMAAGTVGVRDIRAIILQTARELFGRQGIVAVTMEQIAQEAGVGVATVYRHFGDKGGLLQAFSDEFRPKQLLSDSAFKPTGDLAQDLLPIVTGLVRFMHENGDIFRLTLADHAKELEVIHTMRSTPGRTLHRLTHIFQHPQVAPLLQPIEPQTMALSLLGMILGFSFIGPTLYDLAVDDPEQIAERIIHLFLDGARRSTS